MDELDQLAGEADCLLGVRDGWRWGTPWIAELRRVRCEYLRSWNKDRANPASTLWH